MAVLKKTFGLSTFRCMEKVYKHIIQLVQGEEGDDFIVLLNAFPTVHSSFWQNTLIIFITLLTLN